MLIFANQVLVGVDIAMIGGRFLGENVGRLRGQREGVYVVDHALARTRPCAPAVLGGSTAYYFYATSAVRVSIRQHLAW